MEQMLEQAKAYAAQGYHMLPLHREIYADAITPIEALRRLQASSDHCFLLESVEDAQRWGRYTFLGYKPTLEVTCRGSHMELHGAVERSIDLASPAKELKALLAACKAPRLPGLPSFTGGLMGYFAYDSICYSEPSLHLQAADDEGFNDIDLMLFDKVIAFDNLRQKIICIVNMPLDGDLCKAYSQAQAQLEALLDLLRHGKPAAPQPGRLASPWRSLFDKPHFCDMVQKGRHYIKEGDIFQVVLSNRLDADYEGSLLDAYRVLRTKNPSPYMFYLCSEEMELAGASPETLVKLEDGVLHTYPLAGSRPRGKTLEEDRQLEKDLLEDPKELSEHNMLVDLGRNDLGRVCKFGSVQVEQYLNVLKFSHIMHIGSTVAGEIREGLDAVDAVASVLPAGTLSGAPKFRACQIIDELEGCRRGIYGGAIGYLDFTGNMDMCIAIRVAYKRAGRVFVRSGAGIVADSVPEREYTESINKAKAVVEALEQAQGGLDA